MKWIIASTEDQAQCYFLLITSSLIEVDAYVASSLKNIKCMHKANV
jgi:hypothetical protein